MRDSFIFYKSFYESVKELDPETQWEIYNAIMEYEFGKNEAKLSGVARAIFTLIKPQLEANDKKYENGCKGGRPKTKTKPKQNLNETKPKPNDNDNENENDNDNDKLNEFNLYNNYGENVQCEDITKSGTRCQRKSSFNINGKNYCNQHARDLISVIKDGFIKPTLNEVEDYCKERSNGIDAQQFINFYESKGWMVGKSKMKDWKACVRTWEKRATTKTADTIPGWFDKEQDIKVMSKQEEDEISHILEGMIE